MLSAMDKAALGHRLLEMMRADLAQVTAAQRSAQEGATHAENRAEGDKDMRATESSYIARGQASRVLALREELARTEAVVLRAFTEETPLALGALVTLEDEEGRESHHFLMPGGAGAMLEAALAGGTYAVSVVSSRSPLGTALVGSHQGEAVSIEVAGQNREWTISDVA
jgi:transcription elongation GreA/GreB family factor